MGKWDASVPVLPDPAEAPLQIILNCFFKQAAWVFFSLHKIDAACNFDKLQISVHCTHKKENEKRVIMLYDTPVVVKA